MSELARIEIFKVEEGGAVRLEGVDGGICLVKIDGHFYAISDRCSHADVSLSEGEIDPDDCTVECWKHGSTFSLLDGTPQCLPATKPVAVYRVQIEGDDVVVSS